MKKVNYADVHELITNKSDFGNTSNNFSARHNTNNTLYIVWSYSTPIAIYNYTSNRWHLTSKQYGHTTTRHRNIVLKALIDEPNDLVISSSEQELRTLISKYLK